MTTSKANADVILSLKDRLSREMKTPTKSLDTFGKTARRVGLALTALGVASLAAGLLFVRASLEQERSERTLAAVVRGTGISYESVREQINLTTAALQRKSNTGDEVQFRILTRLIPVIGDVDKAMAALPAILDAAATSGLNAASIAVTLGRALAGTVNTAESVGIVFEETATFSERLAITLAKVGGAAEANIDPFVQLKNATGDLQEALGFLLTPIVIPFVEDITEITESFTGWIKSGEGVEVMILDVADAHGELKPALVILDALVGKWKEFQDVFEERTGAPPAFTFENIEPRLKLAKDILNLGADLIGLDDLTAAFDVKLLEKAGRAIRSFGSDKLNAQLASMVKELNRLDKISAQLASRPPILDPITKTTRQLFAEVRAVQAIVDAEKEVAFQIAKKLIILKDAEEVGRLQFDLIMQQRDAERALAEQAARTLQIKLETFQLQQRMHAFAVATSGRGADFIAASAGLGPGGGGFRGTAAAQQALIAILDDDGNLIGVRDSSGKATAITRSSGGGTTVEDVQRQIAVNVFLDEGQINSRLGQSVNDGA